MVFWTVVNVNIVWSKRAGTDAGREGRDRGAQVDTGGGSGVPVLLGGSWWR